MVNRDELLRVYERGHDVILAETIGEEKLERFFQETEPEKISALCVEYFMDWGDSLRCNIVYNFETEKIERRIGTEPYPDDCIEVYSLYPRWTHDLELADLFDDEEIEKFRWYVAGRRFDASLKEYSRNDYGDEAVKIPEVRDFLDLLDEIEGNTILLKERLENIIEYWLKDF